MWLFNSSVGRKVVMSVSGIALVLFLLFHMSMNLVAIFSTEGYNMICEFLGANWYALVGTAGLAALVVVHFVYAFILTIQNRNARGSQRYAVVEKPKGVTWASQNMLVLGIVVILGLSLHLFNFWANMQLPEVLHKLHIPIKETVAANVSNGSAYIADTFGNWVYAALYTIWLAALWFHLTHGFWSAIQTLGINNKVWFCRWKAIGNVIVTLIILGFFVVVVAGYFNLGELANAKFLEVAAPCATPCCVPCC